MSKYDPCPKCGITHKHPTCPTPLKSDSPLRAATCSPSSTPETDAAAYEATTRTVGKWIVPLTKARKMERERDELRTLARFVASQMDADECQCLEPPDDPASDRPEEHSDYCPVYIAYHCRCHLPENETSPSVDAKEK